MFVINHSPATFGIGSVSMLGKLLKERKVKRVMFVCDPVMKELGHADKIIDQLKKRGMSVAEFSDIKGEPTLEMMDMAGNAAREFGADGVVGFGGGSSMDIAKAVGLLIKAPGSTIRDFEGVKALMPHDDSCPVILIPTTAGTSSEVTFGWAATDTEKNVKTGGLKNTGNYAIVDPTYTLGLPPKITAQTGLDLLAHVTESITNPPENLCADMISKEVISIVFQYLPLAVENGQDIEVRSKMSYACLLAGYAFSNKGTHLGHTVADALSSAYHYPHGVGCCAGTPVTIRFANKVCPEKLAVIAEAIGLEDKSFESVLKAYKELIKRIGLGSLKDICPDRKVLDDLAETLPTSPRFGPSTGLDANLAIDAIFEEYDA